MDDHLIRAVGSSRDGSLTEPAGAVFTRGVDTPSMREVRTCDFCGDEAAGTFEVVPPETDPDGEGRRVVLCPGCRDTLASVIEPLLAAAGDDTADRGSETTTVVAEPDRETGAESSDRPGSESVAGSGPDPGPSADGVSPTGDEDATGGGSEEPADRTNIAEAMAGEERVESAEEAGGRPQSARRGTPRGYRKVMRFLENRDFPVDREEAETLAAEAYGMNPGAVSAAIDHAVKHNRLREVSGELRQ